MALTHYTEMDALLACLCHHSGWFCLIQVSWGGAQSESWLNVFWMNEWMSEVTSTWIFLDTVCMVYGSLLENCKVINLLFPDSPPPMHYLLNLSSIIPLPVRQMFRLTLDAKSCNYSQIILSFLCFKTFILSVSWNKENWQVISLTIFTMRWEKLKIITLTII